MVRKPQFPLAQIIRRISEQCLISQDFAPRNYCKREHSVGPVPTSLCVKRQFQEFYSEHFTVKVNTLDNIFVIGGNICRIINVVECTDCIYVVYKKYREKVAFFQYPFDSSFLNVFSVSKLSSVLEFAMTTDILYKCVLLPLDEKLIAVPIHHTE